MAISAQKFDAMIARAQAERDRLHTPTPCALAVYRALGHRQHSQLVQDLRYMARFVANGSFPPVSKYNQIEV